MLGYRQPCYCPRRAVTSPVAYFAAAGDTDPALCPGVSFKGPGAFEMAEYQAKQRAKLYGIGSVWSRQGLQLSLFPVTTYTRERDV